MSNKKCHHGIEKYYCKQCIGSGICVHGEYRFRCRECGKNGYWCVHNKRKVDCGDCVGKNRCIHNKRKYLCIDCNGTGICVHKKRKSLCVECGGSALCDHKKQKQSCFKCKKIKIENESNVLFNKGVCKESVETFKCIVCISNDSIPKYGNKCLLCYFNVNDCF